MSRSRRVLALVILIAGILLLAVIGLFFLRGGLGGDQPVAQATPGAQPAVTGTPAPAGTPTPAPTPQFVEVVISIQTLPRGYQITGNELERDLRLASEVDANMIVNPDDAIGKYARTDIYQGETLTFDHLATDLTEIGIEDYGPSSLVPVGTLAIAIPMDRLSSVGYGLKSGDFIDVMFSMAFLEIDSEFRTLLRNSLSFIIEGVDEEGNATRTVFVIDPYGRFETLPTGDLAHVFPSEDQRALPATFIIQNAKVIQVGPWQPPPPPQPPTATPPPDAPTATPGGPTPTPTPPPPDVLVVALPPQQQLLLKYAVEQGADIDYAMRAAGDHELNLIENVDLNYLLARFGVEIPPDLNYTILRPGVGEPGQPPPAEEEGGGEE